MRVEHWLYTVPLRLRSLFRRARVEQELDEELRYHVERRMEEEIARGAPPENARCAALRAMEGVEQQKERCRDARRVNWADGIARDLRYAGRMMRKDAGFTAMAVCCVALGIGANTAIFTLMNAVLLKSLPVKNPDELSLLRYTAAKRISPKVRAYSSGYGSTSLPYAAFEQIRSRGRSVSDVFGFVPLGFDNQSVTVTAGGQPTVAGGLMVTGDFFSGLGVDALLGRTLTPADEKPDAPRAAVISYAYWTRRFARDPAIVGRAVALNGLPFTIVGVTPPEFFGVDASFVPDLWVPMRDEPALMPWGVQPRSGSMFAEDRWWWLMIMARRRPGVSEQQARTELDVLFQQSITAALRDQPKAEEIPHLSLVPARQGLNSVRMRFSKPLWILMTAVGLVLLIACANVATLLLSRATARQKEMSIRLATGASRGVLIRQLLTESVLLAGCGGALGLVFAGWASRALVLLMSERGQTLALDVHPDAAVLAFCAGISLLTGILFGLAPAFRATRVELAVALKENAAAASPRVGLANVLVAGQVAFSLLLLIGAGLLVRTLQNLQHQDLGFDTRNLLLFSLDSRRSGYTKERRLAIYEQTLERLQAAPGVRSATASQMALLTGWVNNGGITTDGAKLQSGESNMVFWNSVGPSFFETMGMRLVLGRGIGWEDVRARRQVAVINEAAASHFFPGQNAIGHRLSFGEKLDPKESYEIVGVVRNAKYDSLHAASPRTVFVPYSPADSGVGTLHFEARTAGDPAALISTVHRIVRDIDPDLPLKDVRTQAEQVDDSLRQERMFAFLSAFFGGLALVIVAIGLYGTLAYRVTRRTNEIGIRMALGAQRARVVWMILRESLLVMLAGVAVGIPAALAATRLITSQLYGVKPNDAATIAATVLILALVCAAAGYLPARRASHVAPTVALRYE